jgi:hypothetical protein
LKIKIKQKNKMLLLRVSLFVFLICSMTSMSTTFAYPLDDVKKALVRYCDGKEMKNFCSKENLRIKFEIIRRREERLMLENLQTKRQSMINYYMLKNQKLNFLKDFMVNRYF